MRSISQGRLEAERWSVFLYWTLHSHSKQWPALQWFITRAVLWSLTFSACTLALKTGLSLSINARQGDPFKIWNAYLIMSRGRSSEGEQQWGGRCPSRTVALQPAGYPLRREWLGQSTLGAEKLWGWKQVTLPSSRLLKDSFRRSQKAYTSTQLDNRKLEGKLSNFMNSQSKVYFLVSSLKWIQMWIICIWWVFQYRLMILPFLCNRLG